MEKCNSICDLENTKNIHTQMKFSFFLIHSVQHFFSERFREFLFSSWKSQISKKKKKNMSTCNVCLKKINVYLHRKHPMTMYYVFN